MNRPVIAALNGITCGGGLELAMMCDFMVAARSARIGDAHANFGMLPGGGSTVRLPRLVGPNFARYLMYTGDLFPAEQMRAAGLVTALYDDATFDQDVQALAEKIRHGTENALATSFGKVTVSAGIAGLRVGENYEKWLGRADEALYRAKREGRNRVVVSE